MFSNYKRRIRLLHIGLVGDGLKSCQHYKDEKNGANGLQYFSGLHNVRKLVPVWASQTGNRKRGFCNCVCHRVSDAGSETAPRFTDLRGMSAQTLLNQILSQPVSENKIQLRLQ